MWGIAELYLTAKLAFREHGPLVRTGSTSPEISCLMLLSPVWSRTWIFQYVARVSGKASFHERRAARLRLQSWYFSVHIMTPNKAVSSLMWSSSKKVSRLTICLNLSLLRCEHAFSTWIHPLVRSASACAATSSSRAPQSSSVLLTALARWWRTARSPPSTTCLGPCWSFLIEPWPSYMWVCAACVTVPCWGKRTYGGHHVLVFAEEPPEGAQSLPEWKPAEGQGPTHLQDPGLQPHGPDALWNSAKVCGTTSGRCRRSTLFLFHVLNIKKKK